jgi:hypothetical protein
MEMRLLAAKFDTARWHFAIVNPLKMKMQNKKLKNQSLVLHFI